MEVVAKLRNAPISARKVGMLADLIRGRHVAAALAILQQRPQQTAVYLKKLLLSAIANWQNRCATPLEDVYMVVQKITVDRAGMHRRVMAAPRGVIHKIRKRSSHVVVAVVACPVDASKQAQAVATSS